MKSIAYTIFYDAIGIVEKKSGESGLEVWKRAMSNLTPSVEVKSRRVGGATFQVPIEIRPERKINLSIKWLIDYSRARGEKTMMDKLAAEILAASKGFGACTGLARHPHQFDLGRDACAAQRLPSAKAPTHLRSTVFSVVGGAFGRRRLFRFCCKSGTQKPKPTV